MIENFLYDAWRHYLSPFLESFQQSVRLWQAISLSLVTFFAVIFYFRRQIAQWVLNVGGLEHDIKVFQKVDEIAPEPFLDELLNGRLFGHSMDYDDISRLGNLVRFLRRTENRFLNRRVRHACTDLLRHFEELKNFTGKHFFPHNTGQDIYALYPERKYSNDAEAREFYWQHVEELNKLIGGAWDAYQRYRKTVKKQLKV